MNKEFVYLVRGKNGEYARGTKVCTSSRGAKNSLNSHVEGVIDHTIRTVYPGLDNPFSGLSYIWRWAGAGSKDLFRDWKTLEQHLQMCQLNIAKITEKDYDEFLRLVNGIYDHWHIEEVEQDA
ncbi:MAG: hypothetical protein ACTSPB_12195 [Candidatus Thorarchaeota archaeon]